MTPAKIREHALAVALDPAFVKSAEYGTAKHVSLFYDDGEHQSTKAGELYGQRTFHCLQEPTHPQGMFGPLPVVHKNTANNCGDFHFVVVSDEDGDKLEEMARQCQEGMLETCPFHSSDR